MEENKFDVEPFLNIKTKLELFLRIFYELIPEAIKNNGRNLIHLKSMNVLHECTR